MANQVLEKYFSDPKIDQSKKTAALQDLRSGAIDESSLANIVSTKYYGGGQTKPSNASSSWNPNAVNANPFADSNIAGTVTGLASGAANIYGAMGEAIGAAGRTAGSLGKSLQQYSSIPGAAAIGQGLTGLQPVTDWLEAGGKSATSFTQEGKIGGQDYAQGIRDVAGNLSGFGIGEKIGEGLSSGAMMTLGLVGGGMASNALKVPQLAGKVGSFTQSLTSKVLPKMKSLSAIAGGAAEGVTAGVPYTAALELSRGNEITPSGISGESTFDAIIGAAPPAIKAGKAVFSNLLNQYKGAKALAGRTEELIKVAKEAGITPEMVNKIEKANPTQKISALKFLANSEKRLIGESAETSMEKAAGDFMDNFKQLYSKMTQAAGTVKSSKRSNVLQPELISKTADAAQKARQKVVSLMGRQGIKFPAKSKLPNYAGSFLEGDKGAQSLINEVFNAMKSSKTTYGRLEVTLSKIDNELKQAYNKAGTVSFSEEGETLLKGVRNQLKSVIRAKDPVRAEADDLISELVNLVKDVDKATGGTAKSLKETVLSGANASSVFRRALGAGVAQNKALLEKTKQLATRYNIPSLSKAIDDLPFAQMADDFFRLDLATKPTSFAAKTSEGVRQLGGALATKSPIGAFQAAGNLLDTAKQFFEPDTLFKLKELISKNPNAKEVSQEIIQNVGNIPLSQKAKALLFAIFD